MQDIPYNLSQGSICVSSNDIYIFGSMIESYRQIAYKYDTKLNTYTRLANIPYSFTIGKTLSINSDIYLFGGDALTTSTTAYKYSTIDNTYTKLSNIPNDLSGNITGLASVGNNIFLLSTGRQIYKYNFTSNSYILLKNVVPFEFTGGEVCGVGNKIYLFSGLNTCVYDVDKNTFEILDKNHLRITGSSLAFLDNKIFLFGGKFGVGNEISVFSLKTKQYSNNDFIVFKSNETIGKYSTALVSSKKIKGSYLQLSTGFDNAWIFKNGELIENETFYGNGTSWIKFKN